MKCMQDGLNWVLMHTNCLAGVVQLEKAFEFEKITYCIYLHVSIKELYLFAQRILAFQVHH